MQKVKQILDEWTEKQIFPGASLLVQQNGEVVFEYACGIADLERQIPISLENIWVTASLAKPVTTAALMQMVDRKKIHLDQKASDLLPEFHHNAVTIRHLLTHTSGIGPMEPQPQAGNIRAIADQGLLFEPGTKCSYSTPAFDLVERIVCEFSGMTWAEYTSRYLFEPLGMIHSSYQPPSDWEDRIPKVYDQRNHVDPWWNRRFLRAIGLAGGGLHSSLRDLAAFGQAFLNEGEPVLSSESCRQMASLQTPGLFNLEGRLQTWGLGFYLNQDNPTISGFGPLSTDSFGHGGATGTFLCVDPQKQLVIVQLANRLGLLLNNHSAMLNRLITTILEIL